MISIYRTREKSSVPRFQWVWLGMVLTCVSLSLSSSKAGNPEKPSAPPQAWPMFRGGPLCDGVAKSNLTPPLKLSWKFEVDGGSFAGSPVIAEGVVYAGDLDGVIYAIEADSGKEKWRFSTDIGFVASPLVSQGCVFIGDLDGIVYCLDANNGKERWRFQTEAQIDSSANRHRDRILVGSQDATLYCLDATSGTLVWKIAIDDQIRCTPAVVENRTFVAGCDARLHIIDLDSGKTVGAVDLEGPTGVTPAIQGDVAYLGTEGGTFYAIDWKQKEILWTSLLNRGKAYRSSAAVSQMKVVVGSRARRLLAWDAKNGEKAWEFVARRDITSSPVVSGEFVYFGSDEGRLFALRLEDGRKMWEYETGGKIEGAPAVAGGKLVIANTDGVLFCFEEVPPAK